jgi:hypothetical protein
MPPSAQAAAKFPTDVARLFWDADPQAVDLDRHRDYVLGRVMTRGGWAAMRWLQSTYSREELADYLRRKGHLLAPRDQAYWALIAGVTLPSRSGGGRPPWAGPRDET